MPKLVIRSESGDSVSHDLVEETYTIGRAPENSIRLEDTSVSGRHAEIVVVARTHVLDLRLAQEQGIERPIPLMRGMLVQKGIAPNATVGLGLANIYGRKKGGDVTLGDRLSRSRKPAVTFVLKF